MLASSFCFLSGCKPFHCQPLATASQTPRLSLACCYPKEQHIILGSIKSPAHKKKKNPQTFRPGSGCRDGSRDCRVTFQITPGRIPKRGNPRRAPLVGAGGGHPTTGRCSAFIPSRVPSQCQVTFPKYPIPIARERLGRGEGASAAGIPFAPGPTRRTPGASDTRGCVYSRVTLARGWEELSCLGTRRTHELMSPAAPVPDCNLRASLRAAKSSESVVLVNFGGERSAGQPPA